MQKAHVHEIGHLLGLGHSAEGTAACPTTGNTNATACYGSSDIEMTSVMGSGMKLYAKHAYPWRLAIADMTGKGTVYKPSKTRSTAATINTLLGTALAGTDLMSKDWQAKLIRHYPRTEAEVNRNTSITTRVKR